MAITLGILPFLICESVLRLTMPPPRLADPFVGLPGSPPLFEKTNGSFSVDPSRRRFFAQASFAATKGPGTTRIFCLGGSTVQGRPYSIETAFPRWLEILLAEVAPSREWEVVNCGGISYASYRLVPILEEVLEYEPDLLIVYTGHNEFLEDRSYAHLKQLPQPVERVLRAVASTYTFATIHALIYGDVKDDRVEMKVDVDAILDHRDGLKAYHRDPAWRRGVIAHYENALRRMVALAGIKGVPIVFVDPVSNVRDQPPFKSQSREGISRADLDTWLVLRAAARSLHSSSPRSAIPPYRQALAIDDQHAGLHFEYGQLLLRIGEVEMGREHLELAREHDICPLRIVESMHAVLREITSETSTPLCGVRAAIRQRSRHGIPGDDWLLDHVHASIEAHQLIARELYKTLRQIEFLPPAPGLAAQIDNSFAAHRASLEEIYFLRGTRELERLRIWSQGRAEAR